MLQRSMLHCRQSYVSISVWETQVVAELGLQAAGTEKSEPSPRPTRWWQRDQIAVAPCTGLLIAGLISLEDSCLPNRAEALEPHSVVKIFKNAER